MADGSHDSRDLTRREWLRRLAGTAALTPFAGWNRLSQIPVSKEHRPRVEQIIKPKTLSDQDDAFLQEIEAANFRYFWEQANPETGIVRDRCNVRTPDKSDLGSIAATGFGLTALCIGVKRGFVSFAEARGRALNALRFLSRKLPHH